MEPSAAALPPARQADHLGWFGGLVVCSSGVFGLALLCILVFKWGQHPHPDFMWADYLAIAAWVLQAPLALWGLVGTAVAAWYRRFGRAAVWLLLTAGVLLVFVGGSVVLFVLVIGGAPSVGDPPGVYNM